MTSLHHRFLESIIASRTSEQTADIVVRENRDKKVTQWYRLYQDIQLFCKRKTVLMSNAMDHVWKRN